MSARDGEPQWAEATVEPSTAVIRLGPRVDFLDAVALKHRVIELAQAGASEIIVDFARAIEVDRAIVASLFMASRRIAPDTARLAVVAPSTHVLDLLETAGITDALSVAPSLDDALDRHRDGMRRGRLSRPGPPRAGGSPRPTA